MMKAAGVCLYTDAQFENFTELQTPSRNLLPTKHKIYGTTQRIIYRQSTNIKSSTPP